MKPSRPGGRVRLIEGVTIAAAALLLLKGATLVLTAFEPERAPDGLPAFAHVLAFARSNYVTPDPTTTGSVPPPKEAPKPAAPAEPSPTPGQPPKVAPATSPSERSIVERLGERREELQQRARDMDTREQLLEEAERRLDLKAGEIKAKEGQGPAAGVADPRAAALKGLVTMYETMKPKEAARVFERLPQDVLVPVVRLINPRKMAEILAAMSPDSAEKLTVALARPARLAEDRPAPGGALPPGELPALDPPPRPAAGNR